MLSATKHLLKYSTITNTLINPQRNVSTLLKNVSEMRGYI